MSSTWLIKKAIEYRHKPTAAEARLYKQLCRMSYKYSFTPQFPLFGYIADFYCPKLRLVIECDGMSHRTATSIGRDKQRTERLSQEGIKVIRFRNTAIFNDLQIVTDLIRTVVKQREEELS